MSEKIELSDHHKVGQSDQVTTEQSTNNDSQSVQGGELTFDYSDDK